MERDGPGWRLRWLGRLLAPAYGTCGRCGTPWRFVRHRPVPYAPGRSMFVLCVKCWDDTDVVKRIAYHLRATERWGAVDEIWQGVLDGVLSESAPDHARR